jgi:TrmH family RNA methyltransferase
MSRQEGPRHPRAIASLQNPHVKAARRLHRRGDRIRQGAFLAEGPHVVEEALASGTDVRELFVSAEIQVSERLMSLASAARLPVVRASEQVIASMSDTVTSQGVVAVVADPTVSIERIDVPAGLVVVLAEIADPGNAGTMLRSAVAAGADGVVFAGNCVDPLNPKVVRASAGALFKVPVARDQPPAAVFDHLKSVGLTVIGCDVAAGRSYDQVDLTVPIAVVLGNEARGLTDEWRVFLDETVMIPMAGPVESLNVAVAGSVVLFDALRQRRALAH